MYQEVKSHRADMEKWALNKIRPIQKTTSNKKKRLAQAHAQNDVTFRYAFTDVPVIVPDNGRAQFPKKIEKKNCQRKGV